MVIDLFSRRVVGWAVGDRLHRDLALAALRKALIMRRPAKGLIHHSDRGSQGGLNQSSQRFEMEAGGGYQEAAFGSVHTVTVAVSGTAASRQSGRA